MNEERARLILKNAIRDSGSLCSLGWYLDWRPNNKSATLDGEFTPEELEAIAFWMRLKGGQG